MRYRRLLIVAPFPLLLGLVVARPDPAQLPIRPGTSEGFWTAATGIREKNTLGGPSWNIVQPVDGWFLYASRNMHGSNFFRVPQAAVLANCPSTVTDLSREGRFVPEWSSEAFSNWEKTDLERKDAHALLDHLSTARLGWWIKNRPEYLAVVQEDFDLGIAAQRMGQFRLVQLMEWGYLSSVVLFAAWPWIGNRSKWCWAIHAGLLPLLLLLPYYLGYCTWTYTSAGAGGGVLYPAILDALKPFPWTALDTAVVGCIPQVLAPLAGPLGPMMSISGARHAGPLAALCLGAALGAIVLGLHSSLFRQMLKAREANDLQTSNVTGTANPAPGTVH